MLKFIQNNREITALLAVVLLFVLPGFLDRQYLSVQTLTMVYSSAQILILLAMGATLVMLTRNIDVSVGSITGMCAVLLGMLLNAGYSLPVACVATLLLGLLAGFFNGVLVAWLKIPAIVATLGTLGLYRGIMLLWTGGKWIEGLPAELKQLSAPLLLGVSAIGWLTIILVAFMAWLLAKTAFGRSFYATGDNLQGARQLGVRTEAIRIVAFSLNGCMAALAGIVFASQIGFIPNQTGTGLEMKAIAACVLGGISLLGGSGAIIGAVLGAWFLTQIDSVLVLMCALCHDGAGVCGRRCAAGIVFWFSTFRSRCVVSDARHHRRGAWRGQYLWWFRFHYRHRHCGFISGIFATRFANGRSAKSGVQRPFRCATYRRCRRSFR